MAPLRTLAGAGMLAALLASSAASQDVGATSLDLDLDADGTLSQQEFRDGFTQRGVLSTWDADADGLLSREEFGSGVYDRYDTDLSGDLGIDEYARLGPDYAAEGRWYRNGSDVAGADGWDADADGVLQREEFDQGFDDYGTFDSFDADVDGYLSEDELSDGVFSGYGGTATGPIERPDIAEITDDLGEDGYWDL